MASIILTAINLSATPKVNQVANLKYRLSSDPDIAASYINLGDAIIKPSGDLLNPITIDSLVPNTSYTVWATIACSNSQFLKSFTTLFIPCGSTGTFTGAGIFYPKTFQVTSGTDTGPFIFYFFAGHIPDRFVVRDSSGILFDSGYVGDPTKFQTAINEALADMGLPPAVVTDTDGRVYVDSIDGPGVGTGSGGVILNKTTFDQYIYVDVYSILDTTTYSFIVGCPNGIYYTKDRSGSYTKNDCTPPQVGSTVSFTKTYYAPQSQMAADQAAALDSIFDQRGQEYANENGTCSIPIIPCGDESSFTGGESFPTEQIVTLGSGTGIVTLNFDAFTVPDKFIVIFDGVEVINTGYRGDVTEQGFLDTELASRGLPPETISGVTPDSMSFNKTTATTIATVRVYAPLSGTAWTYSLSCPV